MAKKALLMILDGWGIGNKGEGDVIYRTPTPYLDYLNAVSPHSQLDASGEDVGLPDGQMGNSEVGHLNIGAGRIVYQDLVKINRACKDGSILKNPEIVSAYEYAKKNNKSIHLMGLTSSGGVHSSLVHLYKLLDIAKEYGIENTFVHCFMDGRDTDPKSGKGFIQELQDHQLVEGKGRLVNDMVEGVQSCYDTDSEAHKNTDEFMEPIVNANVDGRIKEGDVVIFFNYRNDRAKELTIVLTQKDMEEQGMKTIPGLQYYCMTPYDASFTGVHILFPK